MAIFSSVVGPFRTIRAFHRKILTMTEFVHTFHRTLHSGCWSELRHAELQGRLENVNKEKQPSSVSLLHLTELCLQHEYFLSVWSILNMLHYVYA